MEGLWVCMLGFRWVCCKVLVRYVDFKGGCILGICRSFWLWALNMVRSAGLGDLHGWTLGIVDLVNRASFFYLGLG